MTESIQAAPLLCCAHVNLKILTVDISSTLFNSRSIRVGRVLRGCECCCGCCQDNYHAFTELCIPPSLDLFVVENSPRETLENLATSWDCRARKSCWATSGCDLFAQVDRKEKSSNSQEPFDIVYTLAKLNTIFVHLSVGLPLGAQVRRGSAFLGEIYCFHCHLRRGKDATYWGGDIFLQLNLASHSSPYALLLQPLRADHVIIYFIA